MQIVRLRERGQLTLPSEVRKLLKLKAGDYLEVQLQGDFVVLKPKKAIEGDRIRLMELIKKSRERNKGVDPRKIEAEVAEAVKAAKGEELKELEGESCELRTPLTVMRGQTEVALRKERSLQEYRQVLESNLEEMERMSRIVDNLLTLSRADAGQIQMEFKPVQLKRLIEDAYEECKALADARRIDVFLDKAEEVTVLGDELRLRQMLLNLIDNAVKYTPEGGKIWLSLEAEGEYARISVRDTGIGIPEEDLPRIFDRFYRVDKARSREMGGSGLGLSIVRWIVKAHNGRIKVTSKLGEGSCFTVWIDRRVDTR